MLKKKIRNSLKIYVYKKNGTHLKCLKHYTFTKCGLLDNMSKTIIVSFHSKISITCNNILDLNAVLNYRLID